MPCFRESWFIHILVQPHACRWLGNLLCAPQVTTLRLESVSSFLLAQSELKRRTQGQFVWEARRRVDHLELCILSTVGPSVPGFQCIVITFAL